MQYNEACEKGGGVTAAPTARRGMTIDTAHRLAPSAIWSPSPSLSPRAQRLRDEYFSFYSRDYFRNEVRPYGSGTPWDEARSPYHWGVVPEMYVFFDSFRDRLLAAAETVPLPAGFWKEALGVRRAPFFR